jgi:predicted nucleic acid-binding protein
VIVADTSGLLALFNRSEPDHPTVRDVVRRLDEPMVVAPYVVAEVDCLVATRIGVDAEIEVLSELSGGAYVLPEFGQHDLARALGVVRRYRDQAIGVADASVVVLAERYATRTILTLDRRHFDVLRPLQGGRFRLLP